MNSTGLRSEQIANRRMKSGRTMKTSEKEKKAEKDQHQIFKTQHKKNSFSSFSNGTFAGTGDLRRDASATTAAMPYFVNISDLYSSSAQFSEDLEKFLLIFQPFTEKRGADPLTRKKVFAAYDRTGLNRLGIRELKKFVLDKLTAEFGQNLGKKIFDVFEPVYRLAYNATKDFKKLVSPGDVGDYVCFQHFRILNIHLCEYVGMFDAFCILAAPDDQGVLGILRNQWIGGYQRLASSGFVAFEQINEASASATFDEINIGNKEIIRFTEFCMWVTRELIMRKTETLAVGNGDYVSSEITTAQTTLNAISKEKMRQTRKLHSLRSMNIGSPDNSKIEKESKSDPALEDFLKRDSPPTMKSFDGAFYGTQTKLEEEYIPFLEDESYSTVILDHRVTTVPSQPRNLSGGNSIGRLSEGAKLEEKNIPFLEEKSDSAVMFDDRITYVQPRKSIGGLSEGAKLALLDFGEHLKFLGKTCMDEEAFNIILDDMGYTRDRTGLFDRLLREVCFYDGILREELGTESSLPKRSIGVEDMLSLYVSEPYHLLDSDADTGDALMEYIREQFRGLDIDGDGHLDRKEVTKMLQKVLSSTPTEAEIDAVFQRLDVDGSGGISYEEFVEVLRPNKNETVDIPAKFNYSFLDPALVESTDFIAELEHFCLSHHAVEHHYLQNLAGASFGKAATLDLLVKFFAAYSHFNLGFITNLRNLIDLLQKQEHKEILSENLEEEMGHYDEETLVELENMNISRKSVVGIPHTFLFAEMLDCLEGKIGSSYRAFVPDNIVSIKNDAIEELTAAGKSGLLAAVYFGSELIVPKLYSKLIQGLRNSCGEISNEELRFLILHIDMDDGHAKKLREIVMDSCNTMEERVALLKNTEKILNARVKFYDALRAWSSFRQSMLSTNALSTKDFYNKQATEWCRFLPKTLSDFACLPIVFDMCKNHVKNSSIIDLGCGEGYAGRRLKSMGAYKVVGVDVSDEMIECARNSSAKDSGEYHLVGDAVELKKVILENSARINMMLGAKFDVGVFELAVSIQLFSDMTISDMNKSFEQIYSLLKPGGHFVFSVPHPSHFHHVNGQEETKGYFTLRDKVISGHNKTVRGKDIESRVYFKVFEDYTNAVKAAGFEMVDLKEARPKPEDLLDNADFFSEITDHPLYLVFKVSKPKHFSSSAEVTSSSSLNMLPKRLTWNRTIKRNFGNAVNVFLSEAVNAEVCTAALQCYQRGLSADEIVIGRDVGTVNLKLLKTFCASVRSKLLHQTGAVIIKGLDMKRFGGVEDLDKMTACSKIAYYIICEHIGTVDGGARGKLFDVKSANIDASNKKNDNVLFSVSDTEAGWHTDGASKDRVYDVVGLLCISPASKGGKFRIANACNAFDHISKTMPKFVMHEMTRALPRDILENGKGFGSIGSRGKSSATLRRGSIDMRKTSDALSRSNDVLAMRIRYNSYPIFQTEGDRLRFRYMRYWIETGHEKTGWAVPTLLKIAMDLLDDRLDEECAFHDALKRGDIVFTNNSITAHARDAFENDANSPPRHLVRAWLQIQKADILNFQNENVEHNLRQNLRGSFLSYYANNNSFE